MSTKKWIDRLFFLFLVIFALLYVGAKIHFFTRYFKFGPAGYLEEHWVLGSFGDRLWSLGLSQLGEEARRTPQSTIDAAFHPRAVAEVHSGVC